MGEMAAFYLRILTIPDGLARGSSTATIAGYNAAIFFFVFVPVGWLYTRVGISATAFGLKKPLDAYLMPAIACTMPLAWGQSGQRLLPSQSKRRVFNWGNVSTPSTLNVLFTEYAALACSYVVKG